MLIEAPSSRRKVRFSQMFGRFSGFAEFPSIEELLPNPWSRNNTDGMKKYPYLLDHYGRASTISGQIDRLGAEPEAKSLQDRERAVKSQLLAAIDQVRINYEWDQSGIFGKTRSPPRLAALNSAIDAVNHYVEVVYPGELAPQIGAVQARIDTRRAKEVEDRARAEQLARDKEEARLKAESAALERKAAEEDAKQRAQEALAKEEELKKAKTERLIVVEEKAVAIEHVDLVKQQASSLVDLNKAQRDAMIATGQISPLQAAMGNPTVLAGLAGAVGLGIYLYVSKRKGRR